MEIELKEEVIIWLDDLRDPTTNEWIEWISINVLFDKQLRKVSTWDSVKKIMWLKNYDEFIKWIKDNDLPWAICFDHDLGSDIAREKVANGMSKSQARKEKKGTKTGFDCAKWLVEYCMDNKKSIPIYAIQSANVPGRENIDGLLQGFIKHNP